MNFSLKEKRIWVAGHRGMVGGAILRRLAAEECEILTIDRKDIDLRRQAEVEEWLAQVRPDVVVLAAARVGGIRANSDFPADFIYDNLAIETSVIHGAYKSGVKKLLFLGSSCIYPREAAPPLAEDALLSGALEPTNEWYALAKIVGVKLCQAYRRQYGCDFIAALPCNLYGPGDTYDDKRSHVIPALIMRMDRARREGMKSVTVWGSGRPLREFLYVDDLAEALVLLLLQYSGEKPVNIGSGREISISMLAEEIAKATGFSGELIFDSSFPDGTARKLLDSSRIHALGWRSRTSLRDGLIAAYSDYRAGLSHAA